MAVNGDLRWAVHEVIHASLSASTVTGTFLESYQADFMYDVEPRTGVWSCLDCHTVETFHVCVCKSTVSMLPSSLISITRYTCRQLEVYPFAYENS